MAYLPSNGLNVLSTPGSLIVSVIPFSKRGLGLSFAIRCNRILKFHISLITSLNAFSEFYTVTRLGSLEMRFIWT